MADAATMRQTARRRTTFAAGSNSRQYDHEVLELARVVRVVKGGRRFRFRATVIVGDRSGSVGYGIGKSKDVQQAIQKAQDHAAKNIVRIKVKDGTIGHSEMASYKSATVMVKPAKPGTGVIAGGTVRMVADLAGVKDLVSKRYGSPNRLSNARAAILALLRSGRESHRKATKK